MKSIYFYKKIEKITEGGNARNNQFNLFLTKKKWGPIEFSGENKTIRLLSFIKFYIICKLQKDSTIFFHYSLLRHFFGDKLLSNEKISVLIKSFLSKISMKNLVIIEVNDLPHEQAIDLINVDNNLNVLDKNIFTINTVKFIFASISMSEYIADKYKTPKNNIFTAINGGPQSSINCLTKTRTKILNFVYIGSIRKTGGISEIIGIFKNLPHNLLLIGEDGEWVEPLVRNFKNISYLGAKDEATAHQIAEACDCGLIPYDTSKFYYNICYPTKASFYITANIPFISTDSTELKKHFSDSYVFFADIDMWKEVIQSDYFTSSLLKKKENIKHIKNNYLWQEILEKTFVDIC